MLRKLFRRAPRIHVIDPSCLHPLGHHVAVNQLIAKWGAKFGFETQVFVNRWCDAKVRTLFDSIPVLRYFPIREAPEDIDALRNSLAQFNDDTLNRLLPYSRDIREGDRVVMHTAHPWAIGGLHSWLAQSGMPKVNISIIFRFAPDYNIKPAARLVITKYFGDVLAQLRSLDPNVGLFADTPGLAEICEKQFGAPFFVIPISVDIAAADKSAPLDMDGPVRFVFAGEARTEKGIDFVPKAAEGLAAHDRHARIILQTCSGASETSRRRLELAPNIEILGQSLHGKSYQDFLLSGTYILTQYDPDQYTLRTSHIFVEALSLGRPVVTSKGSWMEDELARLAPGAGICVDYSAEGLLSGLVAGLEQSGVHLTAARGHMDQVRSRHSAERFFRAVVLHEQSESFPDE